MLTINPAPTYILEHQEANSIKLLSTNTILSTTRPHTQENTLILIQKIHG